ncbi:MAG: DNA methylase [Sphaerochaetaceae bacterium]
MKPNKKNYVIINKGGYMTEKLRCYFVIDMKSFFASVECAERGLDAMTTNLVVADADRTEKTICLAVSPSMKKLGVKNRCRLFQVPKNIDYIIAKPRMQKYIEYAAKIYSIYLKYISKDDIHVYSIDECFLDVTDYLAIYKIKARDFAKKLMQEINDKLHIPSTCGIGTNLYLAKIALDITAKHSPDRIGWLTEEKFIKELWHHKPLKDFWIISDGTINRLLNHGITDMAGIANYDADSLYKEFGINAELLIDHAWGRETCLMSDIKNYRSKSKSISNSQILPRGYSFDDAKVVLNEMIQDGCYRLARENKVAKLIHVFIGYEGIKSQKELVKGTRRMKFASNLYSRVNPYAESIFDEVVDKKKLVRRLGFDLSDLMDDEYEQYDFFTDVNALMKEKKLTKTLLNLKDRYGKNAILKGLDYMPNATQRERNQTIGGHNSGTDENA